MPETLGSRSAGGTAILVNEFHARDQLYRTIRRFGLFLLLAFVAYQARIALVAFAGVNTKIDIHAVLRAFIDVRVELAATVSAITTGWAVTENLLRKRAIKRLHSRIKLLELTVDPRRQTSGLTEIGTTNPQDREL